MKTQIVGLDVSKASVVACVLAEMPADLLDFSRKYRPIKAEATREGIATIAALGEVFAMEPTGSYHRIWAEELQKQGKLILFVSGVRVRNHARDSQILDKSDRSDAAVIASFAAKHLNAGNQKAFIDLPRQDLRETYLTLRSIPRVRTGLMNRLRGRLTFEVASRAKASTADRAWGSDQPAALWRELAGEPVRGLTQRQQARGNEIGRGLSPISQRMAGLICDLERFESELEQTIEQSLIEPAISRYQPVWDKWGIPRRTQAAIVAAIHPLEQFLGENNDRIIERVWNEAGEKTTKRDRSLKRFQRVLGCGKIRVQSGDSTRLVSTGDKEVRASLVMFLDSKVAIRRTPITARLHKYFGKPEEWDDWSKKQRDRWAEEHNFPNITASRLKGMPSNKQGGYKPWQDEPLIEFVMSYNDSSRDFARLQLYYEYSPTCINLPKKRRILKLFPLFIRWLFADLRNQIKLNS